MVEFRKFNDFVETGGIMKSIWNTWSRLSLIQQICIGLVIGIILGVAFPKATGIGLFGTLFVSALKAVAPILVLVLIVNAICHHETGKKTNIKNIIGLYLVGTFAGGAMTVPGETGAERSGCGGHRLSTDRSRYGVDQSSDQPGGQSYPRPGNTQYLNRS